MRGLSDAYGSWKIICTRLRKARSGPDAQRGDVGAVDDDAARGRLVQAQDGAAERRLAAARFADEAERLAGGDGRATRRRRL